MRHSGVTVTVAIASKLLVFLALASTTAFAEKVEPMPAVASVDEADTYQIARLTGPGSINNTAARWNVYGTDLGRMFEHRGRIYMAFGDTYGPPGRPPRFGSDWRRNVLAWLQDSNPVDGLTFAGMVTDARGHAKEILASRHGAGGELTVIPTSGVSVDGRMFLHYMSVHEFGPPGQWSLNFSGLAYSDDNGQHWTKAPDALWPGDSNFGQVDFVAVGDFVYVFGIPGGRFGHAELARVQKPHLLELRRYEYWDGSGWVRDINDAATVVPAPVGELSVEWNSHYRKWLMMYLNDDDAVNAVVLRTAACLTGPWSDERIVVTAEQVPQLYAPAIAPRWNNGPDIYFALSRFDLYDVFWWHTALANEPPSDAPARCVSP